MMINNHRPKANNKINCFSLISLLLLLWLVGCGSAEDDYYMVAADCYDDETYDAADQMCYLTCELDGTCEADGAGGVDIEAWLRDFTAQIGAFAFADDEDDTNVLVVYQIDGNTIRDPVDGEAVDEAEEAILADRANHTAMWDTFASLIPQEQRGDFAQYGVFTDGVENTMAYVEPNADDPTKWNLVLDAADAANAEEQTYTLIHEFGHVLTLNNRQVPLDEDAFFAEDDAVVEEAEAACPTFFSGEGCSRSNSYINSYFDRFWADIYGEWETAEFDEDVIFELYESKYQDWFVTDYAATNPGEDIAESWTYFVLHPKPEGDTIAEQKIRFFYEYPELVTLRGQILGRLYSQSRPRP